jgi:hypothetical protein
MPSLQSPVLSSKTLNQLLDTRNRLKILGQHLIVWNSKAGVLLNKLNHLHQAHRVDNSFLNQIVICLELDLSTILERFRDKFCDRLPE